MIDPSAGRGFEVGADAVDDERRIVGAGDGGHGAARKRGSCSKNGAGDSGQTIRSGCVG